MILQLQSTHLFPSSTLHILSTIFSSHCWGPLSTYLQFTAEYFKCCHQAELVNPSWVQFPIQLMFYTCGVFIKQCPHIILMILCSSVACSLPHISSHYSNEGRAGVTNVTAAAHNFLELLSTAALHQRIIPTKLMTGANFEGGTLPLCIVPCEAGVGDLICG